MRSTAPLSDPRLGTQSPRHVLQRPQLPRTGSGKVPRALLSRYAAERRAGRVR